MSNKLHSSGMTFIELLIAVIILLILIMIATPIFSDLVTRHRLTTAAENLYSTLQAARTEAIVSRVPVHIYLVMQENWCYGTKIDSECTCNNPSTTSCTMTTFRPPNRTILTLTSNLSGGQVRVKFDPITARLQSQDDRFISATFTYKPSNQNTPFIQINIRQSGLISICSDDIGGYPPCS